MSRFINPTSGDASFISYATLENPPQELIDNMSGVYITPDNKRYVSDGVSALVIYVDGDVVNKVQLLTNRGVFDDKSSKPSQPNTFWYPDYFGNPGNANVQRVNRLFVGVAANSSSDRPVTQTTWLDEYVDTQQDSSVAVINPIGGTAILGASRTSDFSNSFGSAAGGSISIYGVSVNDDTLFSGIAATSFCEVLHNADVSGISECLELTAASENDAADITPYDGIVSNTVFNLNLTCGFRPDYPGKLSAACVMFGLTNNSSPVRFKKGIVGLFGGLDTTVGYGGGGVAVELYRGMDVRWLNNSNNVDVSTYGNENGFNVEISDSAYKAALTIKNRSDSGNSWARFDLKNRSSVNPFSFYLDELGQAYFNNLAGGNVGFVVGGIESLTIDTAGVVTFGSEIAFGSYTAAAIVATGYLTVKDKAGNFRRLLVG